jgi:hypothetical protein
VNKVLYIGTGRYLGTTDLTDPSTQTPKGTDVAAVVHAFKIRQFGQPRVRRPAQRQ